MPLLPLILPAGVLLLLLHEVLQYVREVSSVSKVSADTLPGLSKLLLLPRGLHADHPDLVRALSRFGLLRMPLPQPRRLPSLLRKILPVLHASETQPGWGVALPVRPARPAARHERPLFLQQAD